MQQEINNTIEILQKGGIILYPTDTIWGLGCDATNKEAVEKIYNFKGKKSKSMLVLLDSENRLMQYVKTVPEMAWDLIEMTNKPLTIIYPEAKNLAKNIVAEDGSIGIRITTDKFCQELIKRFKKPIVSTSANISREKNPSIYSEIQKEIINFADYIVNWRQNDNSKQKESSIVKLGMNNEIKIIRK